FYTIAKAAMHEDTIPWKNIAVSGWCLATDGSKMSKSKGNTIRPEDLLAKYSADTIRYWSANFRLGRDTAYSEDTLKTGKRHLTKMWNAARLVEMAIKDFTPAQKTAAEAVKAGTITEAFDLWVLSRLNETVTACTKSFNSYDHTDALSIAEKFVWADLCGNYLELAKGRLYREIGDEKAYNSARATLYYVQKTVLQLFAPFFPYMAEERFAELYPTEFKTQKSIHTRRSWPKAADTPFDTAMLEKGQAAIDILSAVRKMKSALNQSMRLPIAHLTISSAPEKN